MVTSGVCPRRTFAHIPTHPCTQDITRKNNKKEKEKTKIMKNMKKCRKNEQKQKQKEKEEKRAQMGVVPPEMGSNIDFLHELRTKRKRKRKMKRKKEKKKKMKTKKAEQRLNNGARAGAANKRWPCGIISV